MASSLASVVALSLLLPIHSQNEAAWIDPETPLNARSTKAMGNRDLTLVFSDEFNDNQRTFQDGADTRWTAEDRPAVVNEALQYYNSSHISTRNGKLAIETTRSNANWTEYDPNTGKQYEFSRLYQSGMLTSWNKFCFTSGMIEVSFQLPGDAFEGGLWPAFWMLGNLARPNYLDSTDGIWPYSYDTCGESEEAVNANNAQKISNCKTGKGRGSPEIDIIEAQPGDYELQYPSVEFQDGITKSCSLGRPLMSSSLQVAPGVDKSRRPFIPDFPQPGEWYPDLYPMGGPAYGDADSGSIFDDDEVIEVERAADGTCPSVLNNYWYGQLIAENPDIYQDGLSVNWQNDPNFYTQQTVIRTEWQSGEDDGYVRWFWDDKLIYEVTSDTLKAKPGPSDAIPLIPLEPMYLIFNTDISPKWGWNGCDPTDPCMAAAGICGPNNQLNCLDCSDPRCLQCPDQTAWLSTFCEMVDPNNPATFEIDYIRVYQDKRDAAHTVSCNPPEFETREYIDENWKDYTFNSWIKPSPLESIQHGGSPCSNMMECGKGFCIDGECECPDGMWTGPNCQSPCVGDLATCQSNPAGGSRSSSMTSGALGVMLLLALTALI